MLGLSIVGLSVLAGGVQEEAVCSVPGRIDPSDYDPSEHGAALAACEDGDGIRLFIGSFWSSGFRGELRSITWDGKDVRTSWSIQGEAGDFLGWSLALGPDADADGMVDVFVGAPRFGSRPGKVDLVSGRTGKALASIEGPVTKDEFGYDLDCAGDLDGDGVPDLLIGAPGEGPRDGPRGFYVASGKTQRILGACDGGALPAEEELEGTRAIGGQVRFVGDLDGDGVSDLAAAAWFEECLTLWSGRELRLLQAIQGDFWTAYGFQIEALGDLDGDEVDEVAVTAPDAFDHPVEIRSGKGGGLMQGLAWPDQRGKESRFGNALVRLPDLDGDGKSEFAVGAPGTRMHITAVFGLPLTEHEAERRRAQENRRGYVVVYSSRTFEPLLELASAREDDWFGVTLATVPDCDGDGTADLFVGGAQGGGRLASIHGSRSGTLLVEFME